MKVDRNVYNVAVVSSDVAITSGTKVEVGTEAEFNTIAGMVEKSGLMILNATVDGSAMKGSLLSNYYHGGAETGIDFGGITNMHGTPLAIAGSLSLEEHKAYVTVNLVPLGNGSKTSGTTKASAKV